MPDDFDSAMSGLTAPAAHATRALYVGSAATCGCGWWVARR